MSEEKKTITNEEKAEPKPEQPISTIQPEIHISTNLPFSPEPSKKEVVKVEETVKATNVIIAILFLVGFTFGLILLFDKDLRERIKKRFAKHATPESKM